MLTKNDNFRKKNSVNNCLFLMMVYENICICICSSGDILEKINKFLCFRAMFIIICEFSFNENVNVGWVGR